MMNELVVPMSRVAKNLTITARLSGLRVFSIRKTIGLFLVKIGGWIVGTKIKIVEVGE